MSPDIRPLAAPAQPANLTAQALDATSIQLTWDAVAGADGYTVYRSLTPDGTFTEVNNSATNTYTDEGLLPNTVYYYKVAAYTGSDYSPETGPVNATTQRAVPSVPTQLAAQALSSTSIRLTWQAAADATGYRVYRSDTEAGAYTQIGTSQTTDYSDTGLNPNTAYFYRVAAYNDVGESAQAGPASATTLADAPVAPTQLEAKALSSSSVQLTWTAVADADGYRVYRGSAAGGPFSQVGTTQAAVLTYTDTGLSPNTTYYYKVAAYNTTGESAQAGPASATTLADPPVAPTQLAAQALSASSIRLSWNAVTGATGYRVYRSATSAGTYTQVGTAQGTGFTDTGLSPNTTYYYKVAAYNTAGESAQAGPASATTLADPPVAPTQLAAQALSASSIRLSWNAVAGATGYRVYRSATADGVYTEIGTTMGTSYTDVGLKANTVYFYRVAAYNAAGTSQQVGPVSAVTHSLPAPQNVTARPLSSTEIRVRWDALAGADGYTVYRSMTFNGPFTPLVSTQDVSHTDGGLRPDTQYVYKVAGIWNGTTGAQSNAAVATTLGQIPVPDYLQAEATGSHCIRICWNAAAGVDGYYLYRSLSAAGPYQWIGSSCCATYLDTCLKPATPYFYTVVAYQGCRVGQQAGPVSATTDGPSCCPCCRCNPCCCGRGRNGR